MAGLWPKVKSRRQQRNQRDAATIRSTAMPLSPHGRRTPLVDVDAGDGPGDDQPLDLARAFEDRVDLRVTVPALHRVLTDVAVAAHDLDGLFGCLLYTSDAADDLLCVDLGGRRI